MAILGVETLEDFGMLIGCQKAKVSKILSGEQKMSKSQAQLTIERLGLELSRPGAIKYLLENLKGQSNPGHEESLCATDDEICRMEEIRFGRKKVG